MIEGVGVEWTTDRAMERTRSDGRCIVLGLAIAEGVTVEAKVDPARAEIEAFPLSIAAVDARGSLEATQ